MVEAGHLEPCGDTEKVEPLLVIVRRVRLSSLISNAVDFV